VIGVGVTAFETVHWLSPGVQAFLETEGVAGFFSRRANVAKSSSVNNYMVVRLGIHLRHPLGYSKIYDLPELMAYFLVEVAVRDDGLIFRVTRPFYRCHTSRATKVINSTLAVWSRHGFNLVEILRPARGLGPVDKIGKRSSTGENVARIRLMLNHSCSREGCGLQKELEKEKQ
jgi:hypothetical protein